MAKRTLVQLCHSLNLKKHRVNDWLISEKLDGIRCWWDGGISRRMRVEDVPFANSVKDGRYIETRYATGLWSRSGKAKAAPDWFLDQLPNICLDGELWMGHGKWQQLSSIVNSLDRSDWHDVKYVVFDSPPLDVILADGVIDIRMGSILYKLRFEKIADWIKDKKVNVKTTTENTTFQESYGILREMGIDKENVMLLSQKSVPVKTDDIPKFLEDELTRVVDNGGEGLIIRNRFAVWEACRSHNCLKFKPFEDDEAVVVGYVWGRETDFGSKLLGKMGALICDYKGKQLELSGFTDDERKMTLCPFPRDYDPTDHFLTATEGERFPGQKISRDWYNEQFRVGSVVTFRYRELSDTGIPKEARYLRTRFEH